MFIPEVGKGNFLAAIDGDGVAVVDQVALELLATDETVHKFDVRLLDLADIYITQQSEQGIGMWEGLQLWKQPTQVVLEHGPGDLFIGCTSGAVVKDEHQDPVKHQQRDLVFGLVGVSRVGDLLQAFE